MSLNSMFATNRTNVLGPPRPHGNNLPGRLGFFGNWLCPWATSGTLMMSWTMMICPLETKTNSPQSLSLPSLSRSPFIAIVQWNAHSEPELIGSGGGGEKDSYPQLPEETEAEEGGLLRVSHWGKWPDYDSTQYFLIFELKMQIEDWTIGLVLI